VSPHGLPFGPFLACLTTNRTFCPAEPLQAQLRDRRSSASCCGSRTRSCPPTRSHLCVGSTGREPRRRSPVPFVSPRGCEKRACGITTLPERRSARRCLRPDCPSGSRSRSPALRCRPTRIVRERGIPDHATRDVRPERHRSCRFDVGARLDHRRQDHLADPCSTHPLAECPDDALGHTRPQPERVASAIANPLP